MGSLVGVGRKCKVNGVIIVLGSLCTCSRCVEYGEFDGVTALLWRASSTELCRCMCMCVVHVSACVCRDTVLHCHSVVIVPIQQT